MEPGRELFERLTVEGWALIEEWKADSEAETLHLEFKRKTNGRVWEIGQEDRAHVAKTLSALANTEGGLLVIGVDAGGGTRHGFDRVTGVTPIVDVERFGGALERIVRTLTDPPIAGLMVKAIEKPGAKPSGVVAVHVPQSRGGPHRVAGATAETNDRYYMRTAAGAQTIPHSMLGALFAYTSPPRLEFRARFVAFEEGRLPEVELRLVNRSRAAARRPAVMLFGPPALEIGPDTSQFGFVARFGTTEEGRRYVIIEHVGDMVLYPGPGAVLRLARCRVEAKSATDLTVDFDVRVMSLDTQPIEGTGRLRMGDHEDRALGLARRVVVAEQEGAPAGAPDL